jgi:hypothetical protein
VPVAAQRRVGDDSAYDSSDSRPLHAGTVMAIGRVVSALRPAPFEWISGKLDAGIDQVRR